MAVLKFDGRMTVEVFVEKFEEQFDAVLKVYEDTKGHVADPRERMGNVQVFKAPTVGDLTFRSDITVGSFCERVEREFGYIVKVFRRDGRVSVPENIPLAKLELIGYQSPRNKMEEIALNLANKIEKDNLTRVADELAEKSRKVQDREQKKNIDTTVAFLDDLEESKKSRNYVDRVQHIIEKYGIKNLLLLIGAIISGNWLGVGVAAYTELETIYKIIEDAQNGKSNIY